MNNVSLTAFIMEDKGISKDKAERIAAFLTSAKTLIAVIEPEVYTKHDKCRVYFELWSQNRMPAIENLRGTYFDADLDTVIISRYMCGWVVGDIKDFPVHCRGLFSGAKTRAAFKELQEIFL